ncbi:asparaginase [Chthonobacter rhizosphaerae]|uniref:asparaginase n=1 Tax=Chthonobacter rhizosphaerae TaxID=2735553 RepID=UPI0015EF5270|nr:asparaginase [Chthonobacter rhizosphaerae]
MHPTVHIIVLGGTITMAPQATGGIAPSLTGADLVAAVPALAGAADISVATPFLVPGASLTFPQIAEVRALAAAAVETGAAGVVVVQGTDTIDETSFLLDLAWTADKPLVVTGAMRGAGAPGADGHANLLAATLVAAAPAARGQGVLVVLNDEIHAARLVEKTHTGLPSAFASPGFGPLGHVMEGEARISLSPRRPKAPPIPPDATDLPPVAIAKVTLGDDGRLIRALPDLGYQGLVLEAMGAGHVPAALVDPLQAACSRMPVVLATRVPGGSVFRHTYGFPGSEMDLLARGLISSGGLSPHKARLLLAVLLFGGADRQAIADAFSAHG